MLLQIVSLSGVADHYRSNATTALPVKGPEVTVTCKDARRSQAQCGTTGAFHCPLALQVTVTLTAATLYRETTLLHYSIKNPDESNGSSARGSQRFEEGDSSAFPNFLREEIQMRVWDGSPTANRPKPFYIRFPSPACGEGPGVGALPGDKLWLGLLAQKRRCYRKASV